MSLLICPPLFSPAHRWWVEAKENSKQKNLTEKGSSMSTLLEKVNSGEELNAEDWKRAVTLFCTTLAQIEEPPYQVEDADALEFIEVMLGWGVVNFRLQKNAEALKIHAMPYEDWDKVGDLLAKLLGTAEALCETCRQVDFDVQLQRRLAELDILPSGDEMLEE